VADPTEAERSLEIELAREIEALLDDRCIALITGEFNSICEIAEKYLATARVEAQQEADARLLEMREACAKVADDYRLRMEAAAKSPHPFTGNRNTIAECKADAADTILGTILALPLPASAERWVKLREAAQAAFDCIDDDPEGSRTILRVALAAFEQEGK